jgi:predicted TIM-barrel enzyme
LLHQIFVEAGVTLDNIYDQLRITDGAIIVSYFKPDRNTILPIDRRRVKDLMDIVKRARVI